jgi:hypothetical protein
MAEVAAGIVGLMDHSRHKHADANCAMCLDVAVGILLAASSGNCSVDLRLGWIKDFLVHKSWCCVVVLGVGRYGVLGCVEGGVLFFFFVSLFPYSS